MRRVVLLAMAGLLGACALTTKASSVELRYFSPESFADSPRPSASVEAPSTPPSLHLARVESTTFCAAASPIARRAQRAGQLRDAALDREPRAELRASSTAPGAVRARALRGGGLWPGRRAQHRARRLRGRASRQGPRRARRAPLLAAPRRTGPRQRAPHIQRAAEGDDMEATVAALGVALDAAAAKVADEVTASLARAE